MAMKFILGPFLLSATDKAIITSPFADFLPSQMRTMSGHNKRPQNKQVAKK